MLTYRLLFSVSILFGSSFALIPSNEVKFSLFGNQSDSVENELTTLIKAAKNCIANKSLENITDSSGLIPEIGAIFNGINSVRNFLTEESDWRSSFANVITIQIDHESINNAITLIDSKMLNIQQLILFLNTSESAQGNYYDQAVSILQNTINDVIYNVDNPQSPFKKYPLVGAPLVIELASLIAMFQSLSKRLNLPTHLNLSCRIYDVLVDYRLRAVEARLDLVRAVPYDEKRSCMSCASASIAISKGKSYNPNNSSESNLMRCKKDCQPIAFPKKEICIKDALGSAEFFEIDFMNTSCMEDYFVLLKERVEEIFPVQLLNTLYDHPQTTTGKSAFYHIKF